MHNQYFAALPKDQIAAELTKRVDSFYRYIASNGLLKKWRKAYLNYYGQNGEKSSAEVRASGDQGELSVLVSNEYRNLLSHLLVLTTQSRPAMECRASNTDYDSQTECILGDGILEYYLRESKLERYLKQATEISLVLDSGYISATWDTTMGEAIAVDPDTQQVIQDGDIRYAALTPLDVVFDFTKRTAEDHHWYIVCEYKNKFDLAGQFPELADDILKAGRDTAKEEQYRFDNFFPFEGVESPDIAVYTFYHRKSPALPNGRLVSFIGPDTVLFDGPIPYRKLPIVRVAPAEMIAKSFGYSPGSDLMGLQDVVDALVSSITTNTTTFGVTNIWCPPGHNLQVTSLGTGMNLFESKVKPEPINFAQFPPELLHFTEFCIKRMETLSGVSATARGNPPSADMSGAALALLQAMALQFSSGLQQSYAQLLEDTGQLTINHLQDFAHSPKVAMIAGKHNMFIAKNFSSKDISRIQRVFVDMGNPLSKTVSGRMTVADTLLKGGLIKDASQYIMVLSTGRLDPMIENKQSFLLGLKQENEALTDGKQVPVILIDRHKDHIDSHAEILYSPTARSNPQLVQNVLEHIQDHMNKWKSCPPELLIALGYPPFPQMAPPMIPGGPMPPGGPPSAPPGGPAAPHPQAPNVTNPTPPAAIAAEKVSMPSMPKNPLTGARWTPETGGLPNH
jgi:hypothetical protein